MNQELLVDLSVIGPIGQPTREAIYPPINTFDAKPMNAMHDYVIRMDANSLPPANAFWSLTLYDTENGFFIPNDFQKHSIGENVGMKFSKDRRTVGRNWGKPPVRIQAVTLRARMASTRTAGPWKCVALGPDGRPAGLR